MKYSVLIPVYNTEKYLQQCLESVRMQRIEDYEVIIVNDGSTDNSRLICEKYEKIDARFKLINQENGGLLLARRVALKVARGDYILFLDSDDYWEPDTLEVVEERINETEADVIIFGFNCVCEGEILEKRLLLRDHTSFTKDSVEQYLQAWIETPDLNAIWSKVVKRECIDYWNEYEKYKGLSSGEDYIQSIYIVRHAKTISYIGKPIYNYRKNPKSISSNFYPDKIRQLFWGRDLFLKSFSEELKLNKSLTEKFWLSFYRWLVINLVQLYKSCNFTIIKKWNNYIKDQPMYLEGEKYRAKLSLKSYERAILQFMRCGNSLLCKGVGLVIKCMQKTKT